MSTVGSDLTSSFTIKELTGDKRTLILRGRGLPYRPFELSGSQRKSVDWYPGSPIGTLQVFGAREEPTTISGAWKDKFLGGEAGTSASAELSSEGPGLSDAEAAELGVAAGESISISNQVFVTVRDLVAVVDDMRRKGQEVEVTWLNQVRRGIIDKFVAKWMTGSDVDWEWTFEWTSQGESLSEIAMKSDASDLGDLPNKVQVKVDELTEDSAELVPQAGDRFADVSVDLQEAGAKLQELTDQLTDMVVQAASTISEPGESVRRAIGIMNGLKLEAELLRDIAQDTADGIALDRTEATSFGVVLAQRMSIKTQARAATSLVHMAAREEARLLGVLNADVVRVFQARDDQDLRDVSQTFFDTPDQWRALMLFNRMSSSRLVAGQIVFVPSRPTEGRRDG